MPTDLHTVAKRSEMQKILSTFRRILFKADFEYSECQAGMMTIVWGLWIAIIGRQYPTIQFIKLWINTEALGIIMLTLGFVQLWALLTSRLQYRRVSAILSIGMWCWLAALLGQIAPHGLAFPTAMGFCSAACVALFRLSWRYPASANS